MLGESIQGWRYAHILWVEKVSIAGKMNLRIVFKFINDSGALAKDALVRPEQAFSGLRVGSVVRIHFCLSRVLRVERAS